MDKIQELEEFAQLLVITTENIIKEVGDEAHLEAFGNVIEFRKNITLETDRGLVLHTPVISGQPADLHPDT